VPARGSSPLIKRKSFPVFNKTAILGVGLLGGSLALALKRKKLSKEICGFGRKAENLKKAKRRCIIDSWSLDSGEAVEGADLVVFATPTGTFLEIADNVRPALSKGSIQMDLGSVKGVLVNEMEKILPRFVGCHPIAGGDRSGADSANPELFKNALCIITKTANTENASFKKIKALWQAVGARTEVMDPVEHDRIYALVSHLPHLLAYALVNTAGEVNPDYLHFAGPGFRGSTRIARSSPELWKDILLLNKENVLNFLSLYKKDLEKIEGLLQKNDKDALKEAFSRAKALREAID
jgi:prephenate dehydrogenase